MKIIHNKKEFLDFYHKNCYTDASPDKYPKRYPCIVESMTGGGGLCGEYEYCVFTYFPWKDINLIFNHQKLMVEWFFLGYQAGREI